MKLFGKRGVVGEAEDLAARVDDVELQLLTLDPHPRSSKPCEMHEHHQPRPAYCEVHHILPRSWQYAWHPGDPAIEDDPTKPRIGHTDLFDARTMVLCPTDHRNVHFWLEKLMHEWERIAGLGNVPVLEAVSAAVCRWSAHTHTPLSPRAFNVAELAMKRWVDAGGSLTQLVKVSLYGQI